MQQPLTKHTHVQLLLTSVGVFLLLSALLFYINGGQLQQSENSAPLALKAALLFVQVTGLIYISFYVIRLSEAYFHISRYNATRFALEVGGNLIASFLFIQGIQWVYNTLADFNPATLALTRNRLWQIQGISLIFSLLTYATLTMYRMFVNIRNQQYKITQWEHEYTQASFEALKNQLNPHFLFNSLSILSSLVYTSKNEAVTFIHKLSRTYRYLLEQRDQQTVALEKELDFLEHYCYLIQRRFGNKLQISVQTDAKHQGRGLIPHSMLIVLEYLTGSNRMSEQAPLQVLVAQEEDFATIRYTAQPKPLGNPPLLQQFESLKQRYALLHRTVVLEKDALTGEQIIKLPLTDTHEKR